MVLTIGEAEMHDIASGAAILGTGGGGDPYVGKLMALTAIRKNGPVRLLDPTEVPDDWFVIPTAIMGAPTVLIERIPRGDEAVASLRLLEKYHGRKADATMPIEAGGVNSTIPFVVAAKTGLTVKMGGSSHIAEYAMSGKDVKRTAVRNCVSLVLKIGRTIREAAERKEPPLEALMRVTEGTNYGKAIPLFRGKILDVERRTTAGFAVGKTTIEGLDEYAGKTMTIRFQNENLMAAVEGEVVATVPDLISILDTESARAITTEGLRYGFRVTVVGIPTPEIMRTPEALKVWGPRYFNRETDYIPLEMSHPAFYLKAKLSPDKEEKYRPRLSAS